MQHKMLNRRVRLTVIGMTIASAGCESQDQRLVEYAQRATEQQARQNERIADQAQAVSRQTQELTAAAQDLIEQDAAARRELIQTQHKLHQEYQQERSRLDSRRQQLDAERQAAATAAVRDPVIAQAVRDGGFILAALVPLLIAVYALRRLPEPRPADEFLGETLLECLLTNRQLELPAKTESPSLPSAPSASLRGPAPQPAAGAEPPF